MSNLCNSIVTAYNDRISICAFLSALPTQTPAPSKRLNPKTSRAVSSCGATARKYSTKIKGFSWYF